MKNKKTRRSTARVVMTVLCVLLGVVLAALLAGTVYAEYLLGLMNYDNKEETRPTLSQEEIDEIMQEETETVPPDFTGPTMNEEDVVFATKPNVEIGGDKITNILLIGQDTADGTKARSDTMILCTFNKEKNTITLTSLMRDMYVKIPGYKQNKINAAFNFGGPELLKETLDENFGIQVDGYVGVSFSHFRKIINLLGGVEMELSKTEAKWINMKMKGDSNLTAGMQLLNGREALWYARYRGDAAGDFNRTSRQRELLNTLIQKYKDISLAKMVTMLKDIMPMITTDLSKDEIVAYALEFFPMLAGADMVMQRIPIDDGYKMVMINGMSVLRVDFEKNIQFLSDTLS